MNFKEKTEGGQWVALALVLGAMPLQVAAQTCEEFPTEDGSLCTAPNLKSFSFCMNGVGSVNCSCQGTGYAIPRSMKGEQACNAGTSCTLGDAPPGCYACSFQGQPCASSYLSPEVSCGTTPAENACSIGAGACKRIGANLCTAAGGVACSVTTAPAPGSFDTCANF